MHLLPPYLQQSKGTETDKEQPQHVFAEFASLRASDESEVHTCPLCVCTHTLPFSRLLWCEQRVCVYEYMNQFESIASYTCVPITTKEWKGTDVDSAYLKRLDVKMWKGRLVTMVDPLPRESESLTGCLKQKNTYPPSMPASQPLKSSEDKSHTVCA